MLELVKLRRLDGEDKCIGTSRHTSETGVSSPGVTPLVNAAKIYYAEGYF